MQIRASISAHIFQCIRRHVPTPAPSSLVIMVPTPPHTVQSPWSPLRKRSGYPSPAHSTPSWVILVQLPSPTRSPVTMVPPFYTQSGYQVVDAAAEEGVLAEDQQRDQRHVLVAAAGLSASEQRPQRRHHLAGPSQISLSPDSVTVKYERANILHKSSRCQEILVLNRSWSALKTRNREIAR